MWAVQLDSNGYVTNFHHCTLKTFSENPRYKDQTTPWYFIDRAASFWDDDELAYFVGHPYKYYYDPDEKCLIRDYQDPGDWSPLS